jgi:6,7-dimethyl-8-ribityllumazine synthase
MPHQIAYQSDDPIQRIAIVVAQWHRAVTSKLLAGALETLQVAGVADSAIHVAHVPGSWEIPVAAARAARSGQYAAVICLGAVVKGETSHDQFINHGVTAALAHLAVDTEVPIQFGLLTCDTIEQALERAGGNAGNKGSECAEAALHMVALLKNIP